MKIVLAVILGIFFGYALYWVGASSPKKLIAMLRLEDISLMKIIVFAIGFSSVLLSVFSMFGWFNLSHLSVKSTNLGVIIGGILFGIGFGTVGTCPGTCVAAAGSGGAKKAFSAVLGGLTGAWLFSVSYGFWNRIGLFDAMNFGKLTLFHISDSYPSLFSIGYGGLLAVGIVFIAAALILPSKKPEQQ